MVINKTWVLDEKVDLPLLVAIIIELTRLFSDVASHH
jgi:hypothetical protein